MAVICSFTHYRATFTPCSTWSAQLYPRGL